ncbi:MAG: capsule biosynthesis protein, partial [Chloroflexota bacterium]
MSEKSSLLQRLLPRRGAAQPDPLPSGHILPDWGALLDTNRPLWEQAKAQAASGPGVLLATNVGGHSPATVVESVLAVALTLRGARVHTLVCDKVMPACLRAQADNILDPGTFARYELPEKLCVACYPIGEHVYGPLGLAHHRFSELLTPTERTQCRQVADSTPYEAIPAAIVDGLPIGEHAYAGALRYFARGDLSDEPHGEVVLRRYFEASLQAATVTRSLLASRRFQAVCLHHGIYVPQGISSAVARQLGVHVSTWNPAYRSHCFIFSQDDTYHHTLLDEPTDSWDSMPWTEQMEDQILTYLKSRWSGSRDWIWFHDRPDENFVKYAA